MGREITVLEVITLYLLYEKYSVLRRVDLFLKIHNFTKVVLMGDLYANTIRKHLEFYAYFLFNITLNASNQAIKNEITIPKKIQNMP